MYKYLPYALGLQEYVLELPAEIFMLFAQILLSAPPFAVLFPCKANKRKHKVTFTAVFEHSSCTITILAFPLRSGKWCNLTCKTFTLIYRVFSLTWPAYMQIYWNKRKRLHKKRVQLPEDWFGTPTWPPFHCFGTPIWPPWRHVKTLYILVHSNRICGNLTFHECNLGRKWRWY